MFSKRSITAGFVVAVGLIVAVTYGVVVSANNAWLNYHWERATNPVELNIGDNFKTSAWDSAYSVAITDWNQSSVLSLTEVAGDTSPRRCRPANGNIEVCADTYGNNGWLGRAQIWVSGDHVTKANAQMNNTYFNTATYDKPEWRALVMCQEIGHDFGLHHQDQVFNNTNLGTCMDYTNDPQSNQHPNQHDYDQLEDIYAHLDSDDGGNGEKPCNPKSPKCQAAQPPPPAFDMELPTSGQWGRAIAISRDGGQSVFVQDFGNGYRVFTHVTWTLEVAETLAARR